MEQWIIVIGNLMDGVKEVIGPFDTEDAAHDYGRNGYSRWGVIRLTAPEFEDDPAWTVLPCDVS